jgi:hypothetical protein
MSVVVACICSPREDGSAAVQTATDQVARDIAAHRPELALVFASPQRTPRTTIGLPGHQEADLIERVQIEASKESLPITTMRQAELRDALPAALTQALGSASKLPFAVAALEPQVHFRLGRALGRALSSEGRRTALFCVALLSGATRKQHDPAERIFAAHYRHAIEDWDVRWMTHVDSALRRTSRERAVAQTAILMGALSAYRIQARILASDDVQIVAAIDVLGPR